MQDETLPAPPPAPEFGGASTAEPTPAPEPTEAELEALTAPTPQPPVDVENLEVQGDSSEEPTEDPMAIESVAGAPYNPPLQRGDQSSYVTKFQKLLRNAHGCDVTGIFDRPCELKVKEFQRRHNLEDTGTANEETWTLVRELGQP